MYVITLVTQYYIYIGRPLKIFQLANYIYMALILYSIYRFGCTLLDLLTSYRYGFIPDLLISVLQ